MSCHNESCQVFIAICEAASDDAVPFFTKNAFAVGDRKRTQSLEGKMLLPLLPLCSSQLRLHLNCFSLPLWVVALLSLRPPGVPCAGDDDERDEDRVSHLRVLREVVVD